METKNVSNVKSTFNEWNTIEFLVSAVNKFNNSELF